MDIQKTLTNAWRKLAPGLAATYDVLKNAQDTYNDMYWYDQYLTRERVKADVQNRLDAKKQDEINNLTGQLYWAKDLLNRNLTWDYYNYILPSPDPQTNTVYANKNKIDDLQNQLKDVDSGAAVKFANELINDYQSRIDYIYDTHRGLRLSDRSPAWRSIYKYQQEIDKRNDFINNIVPANNYELFNMVASTPTANPIVNVDISKTRNDLLNRQIDLIATEQAILDNYWSDKDGTDFAHKKFLRETQDEWDRNKKTLEDLWFDMDYVRAEYYRRYPTPQMLWVQELAWRLDDWMKNKLWVNDNTQAEENEQAKRLIISELTRMINTWEVEANPSRAQKLIDLYNKIK